jgi:hypothetical protein
LKMRFAIVSLSGLSLNLIDVHGPNGFYRSFSGDQHSNGHQEFRHTRRDKAQCAFAHPDQ